MLTTHPLRRRLRGLARRSSVRFLAVSAVGYAFDLTLLLVLEAWGTLPRAVDVSIAFWVTYALNFVLNRSLAFHAADGDVRAQLARYLPQVVADYALTLGGVELLAGGLGLPLPVARCLAAGTNAAFNYSAYRWWTFRPGGEVRRAGPGSGRGSPARSAAGRRP